MTTERERCCPHPDHYGDPVRPDPLTCSHDSDSAPLKTDTCQRCGKVVVSRSVIVLNDLAEAHQRQCDPNYSSRYHVI